MFKFILPTFLILLSGGLFFFYADSSYQDIKELKEEKIQYDEALNKSRELREIRDELLQKYNSLDSDDKDRLEKIIPDNVDNVKLIMEIDSIASKYGAVIRRVDVNSSIDESESLGKSDKEYNTIKLDLTIESSYEDFSKFLGDLSNNLRIVDVNFLSFESNYLNLYQFKLSFKTYWLK
ncbi:MAG: type 4a pilus biogenesis protein PilO [Candidatus Pacebacteria bacterium]|nr:type 4a pilus biogenesis protein PilO [Candidatus Paceibacterota bacterium]